MRVLLVAHCTMCISVMRVLLVAHCTMCISVMRVLLVAHCTMCISVMRVLLEAHCTMCISVMRVLLEAHCTMCISYCTRNKQVCNYGDNRYWSDHDNETVRGLTLPLVSGCQYFHVFLDEGVGDIHVTQI